MTTTLPTSLPQEAVKLLALPFQNVLEAAAAHERVIDAIWLANQRGRFLLSTGDLLALRAFGEACVALKNACDEAMSAAGLIPEAMGGGE